MKIEAIDLFCGAGGLSLGLQRAGIDVIAGVDNDPACRFAYSSNIDAPFVQQDINGLSSVELNSRFAPGSVRILAGCAPCQPFSGYAAAHGILGDKRIDLLIRFMNLVGEMLPEFITLENVARLAHRSIWNDFVEGLIMLGYKVDWGVINASSYGVPQNRRRLVLLGSRLGAIALPSPTTPVPATVREALAHLPSVSAGKPGVDDILHSARQLTGVNLNRIRVSKPGGTWRDWPEELRALCHRKTKGKTFPSVYGRMEWDEPAPTITTQFYGFGNGRFGHPEQDRALTLREGALLQSFPNEFLFHEGKGKLSFKSIGKLIGNAVPPKLGKAIGDEIVSHVLKYRG